MGKFRDLDCNNIIKEYLMERGFCFDKGPQGENELVRAFKKENTILWITVNLVESKIYTYEEMFDELFLGSETYELSHEETTDLEKFKDKMDEIFEKWY